jgi:ADP-heptose:LPS heptosyltransferase
VSGPGRIAVFRALKLGDLLCAVPTLRALKRTWPGAHVTLIGLPWARELAARFPAYVDEFMAFPGFPGLPESRCEPARAVEFLCATQARRFDLALQLHGSGELSNPLVALFGARSSAGFFREGQYCPDRRTFLPWRDDEPEVERGVRLVASLGARPAGLELEVPVRPADRAELESIQGVDTVLCRDYVCVHPGAQLPSRRWYPERFAVVADALALRGFKVVVTGTASEVPLARRVIERMAAPVVDLAGRTTLGALTALVDGARLVVSNDTGVRHVAAARGTPCVAVACGSDVRRWPARGPTQRVVHADMPCRPCVHARCPVGHGCAHGVESRDVLAAAEEVLAAAREREEPSSCVA